MASLPNLSGLRPARAPTGPYVDVLRDGESCPLSLEDFNPGHSMTLRGASRVQHKLGLRRAGEYQSRVGCDKAWRPLTYETEERMVDGRPVQVKTGRTVLEEQYYDTVQLGMWLLDKGISPATKREFVDEDRNACIAKAAELVESQGWASLMAYKESFFPSRPPPPPQALSNFALWRQGHIADFMQIGESTLNSLIYEPGSPLHYGKLIKPAHMALGRIRLTGHGGLLPLTVSTPGAVELKEGLEQAGIGTVHHLGLFAYMAVVYAAYEQYKTAHDIDIWANSESPSGIRIRTPDQHWWDYWNHHQEDAVASEVQLRRSGVSSPRYGPGLRTTFKHFCEHEVGEAKQLLAPFRPNMHAPPLTDLGAAAQLGWTPELLVARSVLTLWAVLAIYPMLMSANPDLSQEADLTDPRAVASGYALEEVFEKIPGEYADMLLANPQMPRMRRPGSGA